MNITQLRAAAACAFLAFALAACGGGGGGGGIGGGSGNSPPRFTSPTSFEFYENGPISFLLTANDPDGDVITIRDDTSGDGALFMVTITDSGGIVTLAPPRMFLDFENPEDVNRDNVYEQRITLSDGKASTTTTIRITILNVDEPPVFVSPPAANGNSVLVDLRENYVGPIFTLAAEDPERAPITYTIINPQGALNPDFETHLEVFSLDPVSGVLSAIRSFDYEQDVGTGLLFRTPIGLWIEASDGSLTTRVWVLVRPVDVLTETSEGVRLTGDSPSAPVGDNAFSVGDIDGDGLDEVWLSQKPLQEATSGILIWGSFFQDATAGGEAANFTLSELTPEQSIRFTDSALPITAGEKRVYHATSAGDVDGDGIPDLLVSFQEPSLRGVPQAGTGAAAVVVFGNTLRANTTGAHDFSNAPASSQVKLTGFSAEDRATTSFTAGDFDGDGRADIVVGSPEAGLVRVIFAPAINASRSAESFNVGLTATGQMLTFESKIPLQPLPHILGKRVARLADVDGDGIGELLISSEHVVNTTTTDPVTGVDTGTLYQSRVYILPGRTIGSLRSVGAQLVDIENGIADTDLAYFHTDSSFVAGVATDGDLDGDGLNDIVLTHAGKRLNQRFATVIFGSTVRNALATGDDPSMDFTSPSEGIVVSLLDQAFTRNENVILPVAFARALADGAGQDLIIGLRDAGEPQSWGAGALLALNGWSLATSPSADVAFSINAIPAELGRMFNGIPQSRWIGTYVLGTDLDGDGIGDMSFGSPSTQPGGDEQYLGAFYMLPGRLVRETFASAETAVDLERWIAVEPPHE